MNSIDYVFLWTLAGLGVGAMAGLLRMPSLLFGWVIFVIVAIFGKYFI